MSRAALSVSDQEWKKRSKNPKSEKFYEFGQKFGQKWSEMVKNLVKFGQNWSELVKIGQNWSKIWSELVKIWSELVYGVRRLRFWDGWRECGRRLTVFRHERRERRDSKSLFLRKTNEGRKNIPIFDHTTTNFLLNFKIFLKNFSDKKKWFHIFFEDIWGGGGESVVENFFQKKNFERKIVTRFSSGDRGRDVLSVACDPCWVFGELAPGEYPGTVWTDETFRCRRFPHCSRRISSFPLPRRTPMARDDPPWPSTRSHYGPAVSAPASVRPDLKKKTDQSINQSINRPNFN